MWALLSWRVWAGVIVAVALAGSHWKAYRSGQKSVQVEFDMYVSEQKENMFIAAETARLRERSINNTLRASYDQYNTLKSSHVADAKSAASGLRELEATIHRTTSGDTAPNVRTDGASPYQDLFISCSRTLQSMAEEADGISLRLKGLQDYVKAIKPQEPGK